MTGFGDIVGMTGADEATLAKESGIQYASVCMVDNFANGVIVDKGLLYSDFAEGVKRHMKIVENVASIILEEL